MKQLTHIFKTLALVTSLVMSATAFAQVEDKTTEREKRVAILPITYISESKGITTDEMRYHLQDITYEFLKQKAIELRFQNPAETNALLLRNGVNESTFRQFTPKEIANLLNVEYVITGKVIQEVTGTFTSSNNNRREGYSKNGWGMAKQTSSQSRTSQQIETVIVFDIYNQRGDQIYDKSRQSILSSVDAYKYGMHYLLKRSPLYNR